MKLFFLKCFASTGISLCFLGITAVLYGADFLCVETIFQVLLSNLLIHAGLVLLNRIELHFYVAELSLALLYTLTVIFSVGRLFDWYGSTPPWVLALLGIAVYFVGGMIGIFRIKHDMAQINNQLLLLQQSLQSEDTAL